MSAKRPKHFSGNPECAVSPCTNEHRHGSASVRVHAGLHLVCTWVRGVRGTYISSVSRNPSRLSRQEFQPVSSWYKRTVYCSRLKSQEITAKGDVVGGNLDVNDIRLDKLPQICESSPLQNVTIWCQPSVFMKWSKNRTTSVPISVERFDHFHVRMMRRTE